MVLELIDHQPSHEPDAGTGTIGKTAQQNPTLFCH